MILENLDVYNNIGNLYYELKLFKDAEKIWSDGLKVSPNNIFEPYFFISLISMALVLWRHRSNIKRMKEGTENQFSKIMLFKKKQKEKR